MIQIDYFAHVPEFCETPAFPDHCFVHTKMGVVIPDFWMIPVNAFILRTYNYFLS